MCFSKRKKQAQPPPEETVPKKEYDTLKRERDTLLEGNTALTQYISQAQEQLADLTGKVTALGFDVALAKQDYQECQEACRGVRTEYESLKHAHDVLGFDEALVRSLAQRAIGLLERVSTTHRASPNFKREIDALVGEARSAGLIEEKGEEL